MIHNSTLQSNVILAPFTTFGIGGSADQFVIAHTVDDLVEAVTYAKNNNLPFFILGSGANILVGDKGFRGLVIKNEAKKFTVHGSRFIGRAPLMNDERTNQLTKDRIFVTSDSGITIAELIDITIEKGLSGLEHFAGIPSTLGGALWQNLHFLSPDRQKTVFIGDIVESAEILLSRQSGEAHTTIQDLATTPESLQQKKDSGQARVTVAREYFHFEYDYSILHDNKDVVLSATLLLTPEDPQILKERVANNISWRKEKHPENAVKTSAGSVFKKIKDYGAGRLIERVGLKGYKIGGAMVSPKHANFIVNTGNATAKDVRGLITLIQEKIKKELGLTLQTEISFVGEF